MAQGDATGTGDCPLLPVHRRLEDLHLQWHAAQEAYFEPEAFRRAIQTAIQTSRTVSFILQSNKRVVPGFEDWYEKWKAEFRSIPLMRWMVDARNKIEKQGDLEAHSFIRAEIIASHIGGGPVIEVPAELFDAPLKLLKSIPDGRMGAHIRRDGVLRIQRRWVENSLPDFELLDAVAIAYGHLSLLLDDAHRQMGLKVPERRSVETGELYDAGAMQGRMPCMIGHGDLLSLDIWLADGRPIKFDRTVQVFDRARSAAKADGMKARYGIHPKDVFGNTDEVENILRALFSTARSMIEKDGYHSNIIFNLKGNSVVDITEFRPGEHGHKYLMMREAAHDVIRKGVDATIFIGEAWMASIATMDSYQRAADAPERKEVLTATLVRKVGEPIQLIAPIVRKGNQVSVEETCTLQGGAQFMFAPFYRAWGREIPADWVGQVKENGSYDQSF